MRFTWLAFACIMLISSCKLMKRKGKEDDHQLNPTNMNEKFKTPDWVRSTNIYEVNVRQYTPEGTFAAFAQSLPRLKDMGVETLWFMPVQPVGKKNRKGTLGSYYSISDYTAVNPEFGTMDDFKAMVKQAHDLGFKVMIDWVANHTSWDNVWTGPHPDFFTRDTQGHFQPPVPDWADVIDLNYDNPALRDSMIEAMKFWVMEGQVDGFRCDMAHMVPLDFWKQARKKLDAIRPLAWLGETEEANYHEAFDISYTWEFMHKMESYWRRETGIDGLDSVLHKYDTAFPSTAIRLYFTSNHDENSHSGSEYERMGDAALPFAVLTATWNGIPLLYSGQEIPVKKRLQFFEKDPIDWKGEYQLDNFYKRLFRLHSSNYALRAGDDDVRTFRLKTTDDAHVFTFLRRYGHNEVLVVLNLSPQNDLRVTINSNDLSGSFTELFSEETKDFTKDRTVQLKSWGYQVYSK